MKHSIIPAALVIVSFLVTFTVLSWQEGRHPLGTTALHARTAGRPGRTPVLQPLTSGASHSPWATRSLVPAPKTAALARPIEPAVPEEVPTPAAEIASDPIDASDYLAERARAASYSSRTR